MQSPHLSFALQLAKTAEPEILSRFQTASVDYKPDGTEVTEADKQAEIVMRDKIRAEYPAHGILGEEGNDVESDGKHVWVLDPIDGTTWFGLGIAKFGTLVALMEDGEPRVGVIHLPVTDETLYAESGEGCWYRRGTSSAEQVRTQPVDGIEQALISSSGVHNTEIQPGDRGGEFRITEIIQRCRQFRFVGDCLQHALVARGRLHAALDPIMQPWDTAALIPCIRESGGVVSTMAGVETDISFGGSLLTSSDRRLHDVLLGML